MDSTLTSQGLDRHSILAEISSCAIAGLLGHPGNTYDRSAKAHHILHRGRHLAPTYRPGSSLSSMIRRAQRPSRAELTTLSCLSYTTTVELGTFFDRRTAAAIPPTPAPTMMIYGKFKSAITEVLCDHALCLPSQVYVGSKAAALESILRHICYAPQEGPVQVGWTLALLQIWNPWPIWCETKAMSLQRTNQAIASH